MHELIGSKTQVSEVAGITEDTLYHVSPLCQQELSYRKQIARQLHKH